jgi:hypothetical protein
MRILRTGRRENEEEESGSGVSVLRYKKQCCDARIEQRKKRRECSNKRLPRTFERVKTGSLLQYKEQWDEQEEIPDQVPNDGRDPPVRVKINPDQVCLSGVITRSVEWEPTS